jgi:hypothetical protein
VKKEGAGGVFPLASLDKIYSTPSILQGWNLFLAKCLMELHLKPQEKQSEARSLTKHILRSGAVKLSTSMTRRREEQGRERSACRWPWRKPVRKIPCAHRPASRRQSLYGVRGSTFYLGTWEMRKRSKIIIYGWFM